MRRPRLLLAPLVCAPLLACDPPPRAPSGASLLRSAPAEPPVLPPRERGDAPADDSGPARARALLDAGAARAGHALPDGRGRASEAAEAPAGPRGPLLERGRAHERRGELREAERLFAGLVQRDGDDGEALAELAWVRLRRGDLDGADAAARRAIPGRRSPRVRGAALHTLGRISLRRGEPERAAAFFAESLRQRPSESVERELAALGLRAWARPTPRRMAGPLASLEDVCAAQEAAACQPPPGQAPGQRKDRRDEVPHRYECAPLPLPTTEDPPPLRLLGTRCRGARFALSTYHVVVEARRGLYVARAVHAHYDGDGAAHELRPLSLGRAGGALLLRYEVRARERAPLRSDTDEYVLIVGAGRSGAPSSTPPILVRAHTVLGEEDARELQAELPLRLAPGAVVLGAPRLRGEGDEFFREHLAQRPSGRFPLSFP